MLLTPLLVLLHTGCGTAEPVPVPCADLQSRRWSCADELEAPLAGRYLPFSPSQVARQCELYDDRQAAIAACTPLAECAAWATCIVDVADEPWRADTSPAACDVLASETRTCGLDDALVAPHLDACTGWRAGRREAVGCVESSPDCEVLEWCLRGLPDPPPADHAPAALALATPIEGRRLPVVMVLRVDASGAVALNGREIGEPGSLLFNAVGNSVPAVRVAATHETDPLWDRTSLRVRWLIEVAPGRPSAEVLLLLNSVPGADELWLGLADEGDPVRVLTTETTGWRLSDDSPRAAIGAVHVRSSGTGALWLDTRPMWFANLVGFGAPEWISARDLVDRRFSRQGLADADACGRHDSAAARCERGDVQWPEEPLIPGRPGDGCLATAALHRDAVERWPSEIARDLGPLAIPMWTITAEPGVTADVLMATLRGLRDAGAQELRIDSGDNWLRMKHWQGTIPTALIPRPGPCRGNVTTRERLDEAALAFSAEATAWSKVQPVRVIHARGGLDPDQWPHDLAERAWRCLRERRAIHHTGEVRARGRAVSMWIRSAQLEGGDAVLQACTRTALDTHPPRDGRFDVRLAFDGASVPPDSTPGVVTDEPSVPFRLFGSELQHLWWVDR